MERFGWYGKILYLAGENVRNIRYVERMNVYQFLTALSYRIEENKISYDAD